MTSMLSTTVRFVLYAALGGLIATCLSIVVARQGADATFRGYPFDFLVWSSNAAGNSQIAVLKKEFGQNIMILFGLSVLAIFAGWLPIRRLTWLLSGFAILCLSLFISWLLWNSVRQPIIDPAEFDRTTKLGLLIRHTAGTGLLLAATCFFVASAKTVGFEKQLTLVKGHEGVMKGS